MLHLRLGSSRCAVGHQQPRRCLTAQRATANKNLRSARTFCRSSALDMDARQPQLQVTFDNLQSRNVDQMKLFNAAMFPIKYPDGFYRECCAAGDVTQLAYHEDKLIGAIACRLELQQDFTAKMYVMTIGVLAPYRGLGLGRQLIERSLQAAQKDPVIKSAYLHLQSTNEEAAQFYKKFGFEEIGLAKDYYKLADGRDALILSRSLQEQPALEADKAAL